MSTLRRWTGCVYQTRRYSGQRAYSTEAGEGVYEKLRSSIFDIPSVGQDGRPISVRQWRQAQARDAAMPETNPTDEGRGMKGSELFWHTSLKTPLRECIVSKRHLPSGYMINLRAAAVTPPNPPSNDPGNQEELYLMPDRILHPRYHRRKEGYGWWVTCHRGVVDDLHLPGKLSKNFARAPGLKTSPKLADQIEDQLQRRVLQELKLLSARLGTSASRTTADPDDLGAVLRRLTMSEARLIRDGGAVDDDCIAALMDCRFPKDPSEESSTVPTPSIAAPPSLEEQQHDNTSPMFPLAALFASQYHTPASKNLGECLQAERKARFRSGQRLETASDPAGTDMSTGNDKPDVKPERSSDVFALRAWSSSQGQLGLPLALALKRLDLWRGNGWSSQL